MTAYRFWRLLLGSTNGGANFTIAEIEFRENAGIPQRPTGGTSLSSSTFNATYSSDMAFDGVISTYWASNGRAGEFLEWISYDYGIGNEKDIKECTVTTRNTSPYTGSPFNFRVEVSNDGIGWVTLSEITNQTNWTSGQTRTFSLEPQNVRVTQAPMLVLDASDKAVHVTQSPMLVLDASDKAVRVTQLPILVLSVPTYPVRITQVPILVPFIPKPFPQPKVFVPEVPVTEVIEWKTSVAQALDGSEQRNLLRDIPRRSLQLTVVSPDSTTRQGVYRLLAKHLKEPVLYPLYHYYEKVSAPSIAGSNRIDFDTRYIDVLAGEQLAIYDPQYEQTQFVGIDTVDALGITTTKPLSFDVQGHFIVSSTSSFIVDASASLQMNPVHGVLSFSMISTRKVLVTPQNTSSVEIYQGLPILPFRPNPPAAEGLTYRARFTDNSLSSIEIFSDVNFLIMEGPRSFIINRKEDLNKLRKFADLIKGSQKPFYLPTYYSDLEVIERPANGSNVIKVSNLAYYDMGRTEAWRTLRFETAAGVKYRKVNDSRVVYDSNGQALSLELYLNASLGPNNNDNSVSKVSFMPRVRLTDDRITLTHNEVDTRVEITITGVKQ